MKKRNILWTVLTAITVLGAVAAHYLLDPWGFYWKVPQEEATLRKSLILSAEQWLNCREADGSHRDILDVYNSHEPLAVGYTVQDTDSWCAAFVSAAAIEAGLTDIIPTECGCERQIALFRGLGSWTEEDGAIPQPGDLIYYDWDQKRWGESTGWADHVGIVVGIKWPFLKVIEGNKDDAVGYRILLLGDKTIRGFANPDYRAYLSGAGAAY